MAAATAADEPWKSGGDELHPRSTADPKKMRRLLASDTQLDLTQVGSDFKLLGLPGWDERLGLKGPGVFGATPAQ